MPFQLFRYKNNIKKLTQQKGWSAADLRDRIGNAPPITLIYKWYSNQRQPGKKYLSRLLLVLDVTKTQLFSIDE